MIIYHELTPATGIDQTFSLNSVGAHQGNKPRSSSRDYMSIFETSVSATRGLLRWRFCVVCTPVPADPSASSIYSTAARKYLFS
jgi:hypothetical protein